MLLQALFQKQVINFAIVLSFLIVPVIVIVNFSLVTVKFLGKENQPSVVLKIIFLITRF
jgi:hypothetical protein